MNSKRICLPAPGLLAPALSRAVAEEPMQLPNAQPLTLAGDLSVQMHEAAHRDLERVIAESPKTRVRFLRPAYLPGIC